MVSVVLLKRNPKATWYICAGSLASSRDTPCFRAKYARNDPKNNLPAPKIIHPGPAIIMAIHHFKGLDAVGLGGRNLRKSTCSPICATKESKTADAEPNKSMLKPPPISPASPVNSVHSLKLESGWLNTYNRGISCNTIQTGCVHTWKRLI